MFGQVSGSGTKLMKQGDSEALGAERDHLGERLGVLWSRGAGLGSRGNQGPKERDNVPCPPPLILIWESQCDARRD